MDKSPFEKITSVPSLFILVLLGAFGLRVFNLNYNSPSLDEASYLTVGRVGIFLGDWHAFTPVNWLGGAFFIYPSLSAIASIFGGIYGARLLNILLGTGLVFLVYKLAEKLNFFDEEGLNKKIPLLTAVLVAIFPTAIILSRLATYDMLSFTLLLLSSLSFLHYFSTKKRLDCFLSAVIFATSVLTKYFTVVFLPIFLILFYLRRRYLQISHLIFFLLPVAGILIIYGVANLAGLQVFLNEQVGERASFFDILSSFLGQLNFYAILASAGLFSIFVFQRKKLTLALFLYLLPLLVLLSHLVAGRISALDKHVLLAAIPWSILIAASLTLLIRRSQKLGILVTLTLLIALFLNSSSQIAAFNKSWPNATEAMLFLKERISEDSQVLAQEGSTSVFLWGTLDPRALTTIYYIDYQGKEGDEGFVQAVSDGYFDFIQLDDFSENTKETVGKIRSQISSHYDLIYDKDHLQIYQRKMQ